MTGTGIDEAVARLRRAEPAACDRGGLGELVSDVAHVRSWLDSVDTRIAVRASELARDGRCEPATEVLGNHGRRSGPEARAAGRRAGVCSELPAFHDALAAGAISAGHVDAVGRASSRLSPAEKTAFNDRSGDLLDAAKAMTVDDFARECRVTARDVSADDGISDLERLRRQRSISRRVDHDTGLVITKVTLDPVADEQLWGAINRETRRRVASAGQPTGTESWEHASVDSLVDLATRPTPPAPAAPPARPHHPTPGDSSTPDAGTHDAGTDDAGIPVPAGAQCEGAAAPVEGAAAEGSAVMARHPDVCIHIDWRSLYDAAVGHGVVCETAGGTPLPVATVRRLCCDARLIPIVLNGAGTVLDVGRASRLATADQRRALSAMYTHCGYPGCHVGFEHCQIHHVTDWTRHHGPTDLANLLPLCTKHHHLVHEGGWTLELRPDPTITLTRPDGDVHFDGSSINRRAHPPPRAA